MRARVLGTALLLSLALLLAGCFLLPGPPSGDPSIRGTITAITPGQDGLGALMVEGPTGTGVAYDKASVNVTKKSEVLLKGVDGWGRSTFGELKVGDEVEVWFTGAVAESYPVQATAGTVVVVR